MNVPRELLVKENNLIITSNYLCSNKLYDQKVHANSLLDDLSSSYCSSGETSSSVDEELTFYLKNDQVNSVPPFQNSPLNYSVSFLSGNNTLKTENSQIIPKC